jgi:hypothetical protein
VESINDRWKITPEAVAAVREMIGTGESAEEVQIKLAASGFPKQNAVDLVTVATALTKGSITHEAIAVVREMATRYKDAKELRGIVRAAGYPTQSASDLVLVATHPCEYTTAHLVNEVPATTILEYGTCSRIPACDSCWAHFRAGPARDTERTC